MMLYYGIFVTRCFFIKIIYEHTYYHNILILFILFGELSNFPNYLVYHLLKTTNKNSKALYYWRHIQIVWFLFFRGIIYGHYAINLYSYIPNYFCITLLYIMYFMGLYWGVGQMKGVYKNYYSNKIAIDNKKRE